EDDLFVSLDAINTVGMQAKISLAEEQLIDDSLPTETKESASLFLAINAIKGLINPVIGIEFMKFYPICNFTQFDINACFDPIAGDLNPTNVEMTDGILMFTIEYHDNENSLITYDVTLKDDLAHSGEYALYKDDERSEISWSRNNDGDESYSSANLDTSNAFAFTEESDCSGTFTQTDINTDGDITVTESNWGSPLGAFEYTFEQCTTKADSQEKNCVSGKI
ncbi:MAG: hypothetical protein OXE99_02980, partial [Cellvibrionales bacterium]|nr:hypothetical protein [Cellvibrionales bacterium]